MNITDVRSKIDEGGERQYRLVERYHKEEILQLTMESMSISLNKKTH